jgi:hypothetical protein
MPTTNKSRIECVKDFCTVLQAVGVTQVVGEYSGSGDSGDFEELYFSFVDSKSQNDRQILESVNDRRRLTRLELRDFKADYVKPTSALLNSKELDEFVSNVWSILPDGWENDCGGSGELTIDTATRKIHLTHHERVEEVITTETDY